MNTRACLKKQVKLKQYFIHSKRNIWIYVGVPKVYNVFVSVVVHKTTP